MFSPSRFYPVVIALVSGTLLLATTALAEDWPRFRGNDGTGIGTSTNTPVAWSQEKNLKWKVDLPGPGASSPIIVGDRIYLTCYSGFGVNKEEPGNVKELKRHLMCLDRKTGKTIWDQAVNSEADEDPYEGFITEHGYASSTPVSDGKQIFAFFGKTGLFAFDLAGKQLWHTNLGKESDPFHWGGGASPVLYEDLVIVNAGNEGSAIVALQKETGKEAWRIDDPDFKNSWSTPVAVPVDGHLEMVVSMPGKIVAFDPKSGSELWTCKSPIADATTASVTFGDGVVYTMGSRGGAAIAVRCGGHGDVSDSNIVWETSLRSGIGTPVLVGGRLYWSSMGLAFCADAKTGKEIYRERLTPEAGGAASRPRGDYASPVAVGDRIYLTLRSGITYVVKASDKFEKLAESQLTGDDSSFHATPALSDGQVFLRSEKTLYCIEAI